jgi:type II secretion system protein C
MKPRILFVMAILILMVSAVQAAENITEGTLFPLRLLGTVMDSDCRQSIAVIMNLRSDKQGIYRAGNRILDYQVARIMRGEVVLLKEGKAFLLGFPLGSGIEPIIIVSSEERIVNRNAITKKIADPNAAYLQAVVIPYVDTGKVIGFKVTEIKDKALAHKAGIEKGDIITSVNNQRLDSLNKALKIYHNIRNQERIVMEIKRGNEIKILVYYVN